MVYTTVYTMVHTMVYAMVYTMVYTVVYTAGIPRYTAGIPPVYRRYIPRYTAVSGVPHLSLPYLMFLDFHCCQYNVPNNHLRSFICKN